MESGSSGKFIKSQKTVVLLTILVFAVLLYFSGLLTPTRVSIKIDKTSFIQSNYSFICEHWSEKKLALLREREDFSRLKGSDQFDLFLKLCNWVHNQWPRSIPDPYPLNNAIAILDDIRAKKTGGFCGQYSFVLADVLKSLGFFSVRYVELWSNSSKNRSHFVVEAWSDKYQKWVVLDPDYNIYYLLADTGIPANSFEVRQSLFSGNAVWAKSAVGNSAVKKELQKELYANFAVSLRSDLMRSSKPLTVRDRFNSFLFFKDHNTNHTFFGTSIPYRNITTRWQDLYYDCNYVHVKYKHNKKEKKIVFRFFSENSMPNFSGFLVRSNQKEWQRCTGNRFTLHTGKTKQLLQVCPVNELNQKGSVNIISVEF